MKGSEVFSKDTEAIDQGNELIIAWELCQNGEK
jgi:hypothetical protein